MSVLGSWSSVWVVIRRRSSGTRQTGVSSVGELAQTISRNFSLQPDWFYWFAFLCPSSRKEAQLS